MIIGILTVIIVMLSIFSISYRHGKEVSRYKSELNKTIVERDNYKIRFSESVDFGSNVLNYYNGVFYHKESNNLIIPSELERLGDL